MENLRWILIFAGVAILALLYFSGRSSAAPGKSSGRTRTDEFDQDELIGGADPLLGYPGQGGHRRDERPMVDGRMGDGHMGNGHMGDGAMEAELGGFVDVDPDDFARPGAPRDFTDSASDFDSNPDYSVTVDDGYLPPELDDGQGDPGVARSATGALGGLSQKIDAIGAKLAGKRRERVVERRPSVAEDEAVYASKIITLHVVARSNGNVEGRFDGQALIDAFERREFVFGDMNIFHSMHHDKTVFSIAKMVEPGWFDPHDIDSFATPGITLILQLPGPVAADTAFEVLLSEAFEIAAELGGTVLDGDRSTLSKQTAQHMREGIYEYMHRQKYFGSVTS